MAKKISPLRIGHLSTFYHTALVLQGLNWIEGRIGVRTAWQLLGGGPAIVDALAHQEIDIGYVGLPPLIIGIERSAPLRCIAGGHMEGTVLVAESRYVSTDKTGTVMEALHQFKGGVIGCPAKGSIHDIIIRNLIRQTGLAGQIAIKNYPWADLIVEDLAEKLVDAAIGTPALAVAAEKTAATRIIVPPTLLWPNNPSYGIAVRENLIQEEPELLKGFLKLHEEASELIREHPKRAAGIVSGVVGIVGADFILEVCGISPRYCASLSKEFVESALAFMPVLEDLNYIARGLSEGEVFDPALIEAVHLEDPHY